MVNLPVRMEWDEHELSVWAWIKTKRTQLTIYKLFAPSDRSCSFFSLAFSFSALILAWYHLCTFMNQPCWEYVPWLGMQHAASFPESLFRSLLLDLLLKNFGFFLLLLSVLAPILWCRLLKMKQAQLPSRFQKWHCTSKMTVSASCSYNSTWQWIIWCFKFVQIAICSDSIRCLVDH